MFPNNSWIYLLLSFLSMLALLGLGVIEYRVTVKEKKRQVDQQSDSNNQRKAQILEKITLLKNFVNDYHLAEGLKDLNLIERIGNLENEIEHAGAIELQMKDFGNKQLEELEKIHADIDKALEVHRTKAQRFPKFWLFGFMLISLMMYFLVGFNAKVIPADFIKKLGWLAFGLILSMLLSLLSLLLFIPYKTILQRFAVFFLALPKTARFLTLYAYTKLFVYLFVAVSVVCFTFLYSLLYPSVSGALVGVISKLIQLNILVAITDVIFLASAMVSIYDFVEKRIRHRGH